MDAEGPRRKSHAEAVACTECKSSSHQRNHTANHLPEASIGVKVVQWYSSIFEKGAAASAFLGGTLLAITTSALEDRFEPVRGIAAAGATLFLTLFLLCLGLPLVFEFAGHEIMHTMDEEDKHTWKSIGIHLGLALLSLLLQGLALAGTACVFRVMIPYASAAGQGGFWVTILLAGAAFGAWVRQLRVWRKEYVEDKNRPPVLLGHNAAPTQPNNPLEQGLECCARLTSAPSERTKTRLAPSDFRQTSEMGHVRRRGRPKPPRPKCPPPPQLWVVLHDQDPGITRLFASSDGGVHVAAQTVRLLALDATKPQQTLAPILTAKRHAEKLGFFDLPPEVRILIYSRISDDMDSIYDQDRHIREIDNSIDAPTRVLAQAVPARVRRRERLLQLQLVSRQFRTELLPAWAKQVVHHGALPFQIHRNGGRGRAGTSHKELPYAIWSAAREMLERIEARFGVGKSVRRIKLFSRSEALLERGPPGDLGVLPGPQDRQPTRGAG
ncbi:hypothetical protein LTR53_009443 [Teratosphaeriaceae sp. CCFEE 6253]|nr:hypothetical protein LTR53_009443 [Teratosphaeriaceae sp. CCFEE 6253]